MFNLELVFDHGEKELFAGSSTFSTLHLDRFDFGAEQPEELKETEREREKERE